MPEHSEPSVPSVGQRLYERVDEMVKRSNNLGGAIVEIIETLAKDRRDAALILHAAEHGPSVHATAATVAAYLDDLRDRLLVMLQVRGIVGAHDAKEHNDG